MPFDSKFTWDGGSEEIELSIPLQNILPSVRVRKAEVESLDFSNYEGVVFGEVYEATAEIRYEEAPQALIELILAGIKRITVTYDHNNTETDLVLIFPGTEVVQTLQRQAEMAPAFKMYTIPIRMRKVNGSAFGDSFFSAEGES